jgi:hypothetical protein
LRARVVLPQSMTSVHAATATSMFSALAVDMLNEVCSFDFLLTVVRSLNVT